MGPPSALTSVRPAPLAETLAPPTRNGSDQLSIRGTRPFCTNPQPYRPVPDVEQRHTGTWYPETMQAEAGACERPAEPVEDYDRVRAYEIAA